MRVIAIDWSGRNDKPERTIWLAEVSDGQLVRLENGRNREQIAAHLIAEAARDPQFVVGFDFAFSLPAWFLRERGFAAAPQLWDLAGREAEEWLRACEPPFWGRPGKGKPELAADFRHTDRAVPSTKGVQPKSVFQIGGAGAVGTGSLRGMPILSRLQHAGFSIWPFDSAGWPRVVEIYPRLLTGPVAKSNAAERDAYLHARQPQLTGATRDSAAASEDAFDAAFSALVMADHAADLANLPITTDQQLLREGLIWHPGWHNDPSPVQATTAETASRTQIKPVPVNRERRESMRDESRAFLNRLLTAAGPSNFEVEAARAFRAEAEGFCAEVTTDVNGNVIARLRGDAPAGAKKVLLCGHIDEIGLIVTHINDDGTIAFRGIGGWDVPVLIGQRIRLLTRGGHVTGVIGRKPPHLLRGEERDRPVKIEDLWIDIGAGKKEETAAKVRVGDPAVIDVAPIMLGDDLIASRALDDRCCAWIALEALRLLSEGDAPACDVYAAATVQEEITFRGAHTVAATIAPDVAIALDVTHASDRPGVSPQEVGAHGIGSGAAIARGSVANEALVDLLTATAEREGLAYTLEPAAGRSGTDADALIVTGKGTAAGVVSVPCRYMHSPVEVVSLTDLETCAKLLAATIRAIGPETDFTPR